MSYFRGRNLLERVLELSRCIVEVEPIAPCSITSQMNIVNCVPCSAGDDRELAGLSEDGAVQG